MHTWNWQRLQAFEKARYYALFPRAWTCYESSSLGLRITVRQVRQHPIPNPSSVSSPARALFTSPFSLSIHCLSLPFSFFLLVPIRSLPLCRTITRRLHCPQLYCT
jgi:hypothetical protein